MRILFIAPYPLSHIRVRSYGFVRQLKKQHDVTVLALCSNKREVKDAQSLEHEGISISVVEDKLPWKVLRALRACFSKQPLQVAFDASPRFRELIQQHLASGNFDIVHVEFIRALGALPQQSSLPIVWDAVDCISLLYEQGAKFGSTPLLRLIGKREAQRTRAYEKQQLWRFEHVLVTSERDRDALLSIAAEKNIAQEEAQPVPITALPHGIDREYYQRYVETRQAETLVFSGKMSFHANVAGVKHLVNTVMPLIWRERPNVRLVLAGSKPPASIRRLAQDPRIEVTGYVPDLRPLIAGAQVAVCPLPYAVGIQNKVLEAMALGTPVVASSHAAAGLHAIVDQDLLVADEPELFAQAVLRLLDDQVLWETLSQNACAYIEQHHNWKYIISELTSIYSQVLEKTGCSHAAVTQAKSS